jgi:type IV pilus assembly protein PilC
MMIATKAPKPGLRQLLTTELSQRVSSKELQLFYTQMSILIESGTSIPLGLEALEKQTGKSQLKQIIGDLKRLVYEGQMLSQAMANYPKIFSPVYVGMIRAGESGGFLTKVFQRIVILQAQQLELRNMIRTAFAYPIVLLLVAVVVVVFMLTFILPKFLDIYASSGVLLPLITRILIAIYTVMTRFWFVWLPLLGALAWAGTHFVRSPRGKAHVDSLKIGLPLLGLLCRQVYLERLLRTMGILLESGVSLSNALILTRNTMGNHRYEGLMTMVLENVNQGQGLAASFGQSELIPPTVAQMVQTGEDAGITGAVMSRVADFYHEQVRDQIRVLMRLIEPVMTLIIGGIIGFVALALVLPILQLSQTMHAP